MYTAYLIRNERRVHALNTCDRKAAEALRELKGMRQALPAGLGRLVSGNLS